MSEGLWGAVIGALIGFGGTWFFDWHKEKERQKIIIAVINAKLDSYEEILLRAIAEDTYNKIISQSEEIFKNLTDKNITDTQKELRESDVGEKIKDILKSANNHRLIRHILEDILKEDFLATDHDSAFLDKEFLINKFKLHESIMNVYSHYIPNHLENPSDVVVWSVLEGVYLFKKLNHFIKEKASK